ncbi:LPXTG cell wall anchor domain-containing protein [Streptomyces sp. Ncost-T10-10d]|uniref:LPXTG cell wall anchor domain-containing protein n=1 Tax=Streptomyces sp. Ncost-T10-10d TaxID=1839774 RepID=UPI00081D68EC|nr:LPXTG cell wall anchor domain-containing protein [Streptomyces sp. Ncost-T10-10d]SCF93513.1 LPXTG-motif cell wall anchor domain-containing protein [Streptomyces sp. Ncost-T10-10d]
MRTVASAGTLTAAVTAALLLAPSAYATAPGDNGTVKIHDAATGEELRKNEPHVCTFYLDAFGFDAGQKVDWRIAAWPPTAQVKGEIVKSGSLTLDGKGHLRSEDQSLPDGHYKLFWNFDGEHGKAKHKVFWVDCGGENPGGGNPGGGNPGGGNPGGENPGGENPGGEKPGGEKPGESTPSESATEPGSVSPSTPAQPSGTPGSSTPEDATATPSASASTPSSAPSAHGGGDLAETGNGAPVGLLSAAAAALVAAGGFLVIRRRKAQQH